MKRNYDAQKPELMDLPQPVTPELERDLSNLVSLNRYFGSHRLVRVFLSAWFQSGRSYRVLDLATGAGDIPRLIVEWGRKRDISIRVDAIDANPATIDIARNRSSGFPEIEWICGDVLKHEPAENYDLVCCSLALHHFSEEDAVKLLRRCRELSRRWVMVADLERSWMTTVGVWLVTALIYREPMTKYDGRLSTERAFSYGELRSLADAAGWTDFGHSRFLWCRQAIWLAKEDLGGVMQPVIEVPTVLPCPT